MNEPIKEAIIELEEAWRSLTAAWMSLRGVPGHEAEANWVWEQAERINEKMSQLAKTHGIVRGRDGLREFPATATVEH